MVDKTEGEAEVREAIAEMEASFPAVGERLHEVIIDSGPELTPRTWYGMRAYARMARSCASSTQCSVESAEGVEIAPLYTRFRSAATRIQRWTLGREEKIGSLGVSIQLLDDEKRDNRAFRDRDPRAVIGFNRAQRREWIHVVLLTEDANLTVDEDASHQLIEGSWYFTGLDDATEEKLSDIVRQAVS